jgi:hypothetical protein
MHEVDLLDYLRSWQQAEAGHAEQHGINLTLGQTPEDRSKPAAWVTAAKGDHEAQLMLWSTGESEYAAGGPDGVLANEHHEIETVAQLDGLLRRLLQDVGLG